MIVIIVAKIIGMFRDVVLANYFGTSSVSDAYLIAVSVPTLLFYFIGHSLSTAYIPMFNKVRYEKDELVAHRYSNNVINVSFLICTVSVALLLLFPEVVIKVFASGFDDETTQIAARFVRISAPCMYIMTLIYVFNGYLQVNNNFLAPAAVSMPRNAVIMVSIVLAAAFGVDWLGWGLLGAYIAELLLLIPFVLLKGYRYRPVLDFKDKYIRETMYVVMPILLGMCVSQINKIIDRSLASRVIEGGVSALSYASIINNAVQEVLSTGIITVLFASCAALVSRGEHQKVKEKLAHTIDSVSFLLIPASLGIVVLAESVVKMILNRGSFDASSVSMTTSALRCYTLGLPFLAVRDTMVKVFYAYKDTKATTMTSIVAILVNIVLNIVLSSFWGIKGLAIATSISAMFHCIVLYCILRRKIGDFGFRGSVGVLIKSFSSSILMAVIVYFGNKYLQRVIPLEIVALILSVIGGMLVYFLSNLVLKTTPLMNWLKRKGQ